jgi:hypothetical protein
MLNPLWRLHTAPPQLVNLCKLLVRVGCEPNALQAASLLISVGGNAVRSSVHAEEGLLGRCLSVVNGSDYRVASVVAVVRHAAPRALLMTPPTPTPTPPLPPLPRA